MLSPGQLLITTAAAFTLVIAHYSNAELVDRYRTACEDLLLLSGEFRLSFR